MSEKEKYPIRFHIGTQKAGSTYLYNLLDSHPHTTMAKKPKVRFFSEEYRKGGEWYADLFPDQEYKIDTSPNYFKDGDVALPRIADFYDNLDALQFMLILRNPIDYVTSHFHMHKMHGWFEKNADKYPKMPKDIIECLEMYPDYFYRAKYADLLDPWRKHFDRAQIRIFLFEEFIDNTDAVTRQMLEFWDIPEPDHKLSVNEVSQNSAMKYSWAYTLRGKIAEHEWLKERLKQNRFVNWVVDTFFNVSPSSKLSQEERNMLADVFADDVERLRDDYNLDISRWKDFG